MDTFNQSDLIEAKPGRWRVRVCIYIYFFFFMHFVSILKNICFSLFIFLCCIENMISASAPISSPSKKTPAKVGVVEQEPVLVGGSVADNIRYGRPEASQEEIEGAAVVANASTFIEV